MNHQHIPTFDEFCEDRDFTNELHNVLFECGVYDLAGAYSRVVENLLTKAIATYIEQGRGSDWDRSFYQAIHILQLSETYRACYNEMERKAYNEFIMELETNNNE